MNKKVLNNIIYGVLAAAIAAFAIGLYISAIPFGELLWSGVMLVLGITYAPLLALAESLLHIGYYVCGVKPARSKETALINRINIGAACAIAVAYVFTFMIKLFTYQIYMVLAYLGVAVIIGCAVAGAVFYFKNNKKAK